MLSKFQPDQKLELPAQGSWPATAHMIEADSLWALKAAISAGRPLLLRGEPGCGKSQLARAAALMLDRAFLSEVVHARQERKDLLWRFDAVARLGEAQVLSMSKDANARDQLDPQKFMAPGVLWWAFDWASAQEQAAKCISKVAVPESPEGWQPKQGCVVLIDEIDKAETDLPNGLLETLGNGAFPVPHRSESVGRGNTTPPLVIITTNEERELPAAFLRRCLVHNMALADDDHLVAWLVKRGEIHHPELSEEIRNLAADMLLRDRQTARDHGLPVPGQAEYLDLLRATSQLGKDPKGQKEVLENIAQFALIKQRIS